MLNPDKRSMVTELLTPPPGMVLDSAIATTYTLDPTTLLTVPLHLAWLSSGEDKALLSDGIRLFEALRRIGENLTVYTDRGRIHVPTQAHPYSLLETMIVEVRAPGGGAFHPKIWVLRFVKPGAETEISLRLGILSRNLTTDRSWDLALMLEGQPGREYIPANREIGEFIRDLPTFATSKVPKAREAAATLLGDEVQRTQWDLPAGWDEVTFHVLGRSRRAWTPPPSKHMVIISPFLTAGALDALRKTTKSPIALVSRPDQLAALTTEMRGHFARCLVLDEAAESGNGEDTTLWDTFGLHAKALILRCGWNTRLFVGSLNATSAAMVQGHNVEVWAELVGKSSKVGCVDTLLAGDGLGGVLTAFDPTTPVVEMDSEQKQAELALEAARSALIVAPLSVACNRHDRDWCLTLRSTAPVTLGPVAIFAWPLSIHDERALAADGLGEGRDVNLGVVATADVTGMIGFILKKGSFDVRFALNLPLENLPPDRDGALARRIIQNRDGFLRYLLMLLGNLACEEIGEGNGAAGATMTWTMVDGTGPTLLEEMVRAFARDRERLDDVKRLVDCLSVGDTNHDVVPAEFLAVWDVFLKAMEIKK